MRKHTKLIAAAVLTAAALTACTGAEDGKPGESLEMAAGSYPDEAQSVAAVSERRITGSLEASSDIFTDRDLKQEPDLSEAQTIHLKDGEDITVNKEGVYVISGTASGSTIYVEAGDEDKVQLVLDGAVISNQSVPCIYVKSADKVFLTTISDDNSLTVSGSFESGGDTKTDAVVFSKDDLVLNGTGAVSIKSSDNGISSKDDLKITGGTINIDCNGSALEAHDSIAVSDGNIFISSCNDGLHSEDNDDDTVGLIYIGGGNIEVNAADDAVHATTTVQIDGGNLTLAGGEGIEGTFIQVNNGNISITASDDGINAAAKSKSMSPAFEMNGGNITIKMGSGDTDGVDSNGDITINGGTLDITGQSTFDCDGNAVYNGGTVIENGTETNRISNQMMGGSGGMKGGRGFGGSAGAGGSGGSEGDSGENGMFRGRGGKGHMHGGNEYASEENSADPSV